jgi:phosphoglycolate phosphatase
MLVVFDLDGTVVDSTQVLLESHDAAFASVGLERPSDEAILELIGLPLLHIMEVLAPDQDPAVMSEVYSQAYARVAPQCERLFDGMSELLDRPFRAAVATGKSQRGADRVVRQFGLGDRFEVVLGGDSVPRPKPNPDLLHAIMEATETVPEDLVMIGDTTYDLEMAHAAGVKAIGVSWGHHSTERLRQWAPVVDSVADLMRQLGV